MGVKWTAVVSAVSGLLLIAVAFYVAYADAGGFCTRAGAWTVAYRSCLGDGWALAFNGADLDDWELAFDADQEAATRRPYALIATRSFQPRGTLFAYAAIGLLWLLALLHLADLAVVLATLTRPWNPRLGPAFTGLAVAQLVTAFGAAAVCIARAALALRVDLVNGEAYFFTQMGWAYAAAVLLGAGLLAALHLALACALQPIPPAPASPPPAKAKAQTSTTARPRPAQPAKKSTKSAVKVKTQVRVPKQEGPPPAGPALAAPTAAPASASMQLGLVHPLSAPPVEAAPPDYASRPASSSYHRPAAAAAAAGAAAGAAPASASPPLPPTVPTASTWTPSSLSSLTSFIRYVFHPFAGCFSC